MEKKILEQHKLIKFFFPSKKELLRELPEQIMTLKHLNKDSVVLELGGSIGRNSCLINSIISEKKNHVIIEPSKKELNTLLKNKVSNNFEFQIENSAISKLPLYSKGWHTYLTQINGSEKVNTINYNELKNKYNLEFDTLIIDCEGNFVNILKDFPEILNNIKLIIIEHDFNTEEDLIYFNNIMKKHNFNLIDKFLKNEKYGPGINWSDGLKNDPIFVSVWKR